MLSALFLFHGIVLYWVVFWFWFLFVSWNGFKLPYHFGLHPCDLFICQCSVLLSVCNDVRCRGRPNVEIPFSAVTESRPKVTYHIWPKLYVTPKVKRDFRTKTETESQSCLSRHDDRSQQVPFSVRCPTILCIWYLSHLAPSWQPCGVSLMTRPQGPTVPDADAAASLV